MQPTNWSDRILALAGHHAGHHSGLQLDPDGSSPISGHHSGLQTDPDGSSPILANKKAPLYSNAFFAYGLAPIHFNFNFNPPTDRSQSDSKSITQQFHFCKQFHNIKFRFIFNGLKLSFLRNVRKVYRFRPCIISRDNIRPCAQSTQIVIFFQKENSKKIMLIRCIIIMDNTTGIPYRLPYPPLKNKIKPARQGKSGGKKKPLRWKCFVFASDLRRKNQNNRFL